MNLKRLSKKVYKSIICKLILKEALSQHEIEITALIMKDMLGEYRVIE